MGQIKIARKDQMAKKYSAERYFTSKCKTKYVDAPYKDKDSAWARSEGIEHSLANKNAKYEFFVFPVGGFRGPQCASWVAQNNKFLKDKVKVVRADDEGIDLSDLQKNGVHGHRIRPGGNSDFYVYCVKIPWYRKKRIIARAAAISTICAIISAISTFFK